jgi:hypothetical protein
LVYCEFHVLCNRVFSYILKTTSTRCDGGLAAAHETIAILGRLVALETVKLLTGKGQLVNHINMEEVIQTMASR